MAGDVHHHDRSAVADGIQFRPGGITLVAHGGVVEPEGHQRPVRASLGQGAQPLQQGGNTVQIANWRTVGIHCHRRQPLTGEMAMGLDKAGYHRIYDDPIKLNFRNDSLIFLQNHQVSIRQGKYRYISSKIKKVYSLKISDLISVSSVGINNTKLDLVSSKDKIKYYRWEKEEVSAPIDNYYEDPKITTNNKFLSKLSFTFDVVSVNDLNRIVKAITHLAELSGAKLEKIVDKDTF